MTPTVFGWRERAALPGLGVPWMLAKMDTGARTGALHATDVEAFGPSTRPQVRFVLHPLPDRPEVLVPCAAELVERRPVRSSNGRTEVRAIIRTPVAIGGRERLVELSLTDRTAMTHRLLLGRRALAAFGAWVDPSREGLAAAPEPLGSSVGAVSAREPR